MRIQTLKGQTLVAVVASLVSSSVSFADGKATDFYYQQNQKRFVTQAQDARMFGMAGSSALTTANSYSTVNNPGGLGMMKYGDVAASYGYNEVSGNQLNGARVKDKENSGAIFGATPLGPVKDALPDYGNLGLGWVGRYNNWTNDPTNTDPETYQVAAGYGFALDENTGLGYSLTYQNDSVGGDNYSYDSSNSFLHNVGIMNRVDSDLVVGSSLTIGHGSHGLRISDGLGRIASGVGNQTVDQLSVGLGAGATYTLDEATAVSGGLDYTHYRNSGDDVAVSNDIPWGGDSRSNTLNVRLGLEHQLMDWLAVRGGYRYGSNFSWHYDRAALDSIDGSAKYNAWTLGAGLAYAFEDDSFIRAIRLDYGVEYRTLGNDDWQHVVTLSSPFDLCRF